MRVRESLREAIRLSRERNITNRIKRNTECLGGADMEAGGIRPDAGLRYSDMAARPEDEVSAEDYAGRGAFLCAGRVERDNCALTEHYQQLRRIGTAEQRAEIPPAALLQGDQGLEDQVITKRQKDVLIFIREFIALNQYCPTYEEIGHGLGLSSLATVHKHVKNLKEKGLIGQKSNRARAIKPRGKCPACGQKVLKVRGASA